ncbi:hypothetical protein GL218_07251 [Daldinia childiae]|uniref:uncharacterized protein n=1 Tax=Daldinia childiae TaxID=326645 RepID=UPI0014488D51|nr:uncharacterized protein GL218_07251 [Daldinia childiae]KAF3055759.1 hypothetical protein GL218_07251 [Daldinia childiae]
MIVEYLPPKRDTLKTLRLVNREFYRNLQYAYFQHLVIDVGSNYDDSADDMTDYIMKTNILNHAAPFVSRLGFSFELSELELATPQIDAEDVIEFRDWGIYRWPVRYGSGRAGSRLGRITNSLERVRGITNIMHQVSQIHELAISVGGGLGYLQGPDLNPRQPPGPQPVFGEPNPVREVVDTSLPSLQTKYSKPYQVELMEKRLAALGVAPGDISNTINIIIASEGTTMERFIHEERPRAALPVSRYGESRVTRSPSQHSKYRLQPDQLTFTQIRLIYQHVTAQQALVQSVLVNVMDHGKSYESLTKINIARLSSFHIHLLCLDELWASVPTLREVSLGIVPDWRSIIMHNEAMYESRQVYPADALPEVFKLLNDYIGRQEGIKRLHFEWLCGGELAPGWLQRNKHVLPAPFLKKHRLVICSGIENLLILPHITHLSLKNCWFAPNVFYRIIHTMAQKHELVSLELETVSLTGPPIFREEKGVRDYDADYQPWPLSLSGPLPTDQPGLIKNPLALSWSHIIDMLTPGPTIRQRVFKELLPMEPQLHIKKELKLRKLVFTSCGYVSLPDTRFVSDRRFQNLKYPTELRESVRTMSKKYARKQRLLGDYMQVNTDRHLGRVCELLDPREEHSMRIVFGLRAGWFHAYGVHHIRSALQDGIASPGYGRFSGTIEDDPFKIVAPEEELQTYRFDTTLFDRDYEIEDKKTLNGEMRKLESDLLYELPPEESDDENNNGNGN